MVRIDFCIDLHATNYESADDLRTEVGRIMDELLSLEDADLRVADPAISLDLGRSMVTVELVAVGENFEDASRTADATVRAAIHAAGGSTPGWAYEVAASSQRVAGLVDA